MSPTSSWAWNGVLTPIESSYHVTKEKERKRYSVVYQVPHLGELLVKNVGLGTLRCSDPKGPTFSHCLPPKLPLDTIYEMISTRRDMGASPTWDIESTCTVNFFTHKNIAFLKWNGPHLVQFHPGDDEIGPHPELHLLVLWSLFPENQSVIVRVRVERRKAFERDRGCRIFPRVHKRNWHTGKIDSK